MGAICEFCDGVSSFAIVEEDLCIGANTDEVVTRWCILHILDKFGVAFDRLGYDVKYCEKRRKATATYLFILVRSTCVEDDHVVITSSRCSERSLMPDCHRIYSLG